MKCRCWHRQTLSYPEITSLATKRLSGYYDALLTGTICDFWDNFQLDDCMINQPVENMPSQTYWVHPDHLGSSSVITNQNGVTANWYEYMPFGEMLMEQSNNQYNNAFKYNGKELDEATQLYYYGARYYDPKLSIWLSVDPLAEKYPSVSPYAYALNNPVKFVDPDGRDVIIWYLASDGKMHAYDYKYGAGYSGKNKYLIAFHKAANALINSGAGGNLKALDGRKEKVWVSDKGYTDEVGANFDPNTKTITWKPTKGLRTTNGKELTPTAVLDHEFDHAEDYFKDPDKHVLNSLKPTGDNYDNAEEMRVIQGSEQSTAKKLGLIKGKEVTRTDHRGDIYDTAGVNTTKPPAKEIQEVIITVKKKK